MKYFLEKVHGSMKTKCESSESKISQRIFSDAF